MQLSLIRNDGFFVERIIAGFHCDFFYEMRPKFELKISENALNDLMNLCSSGTSAVFQRDSDLHPSSLAVLTGDMKVKDRIWIAERPSSRFGKKFMELVIVGNKTALRKATVDIRAYRQESAKRGSFSLTEALPELVFPGSIDISLNVLDEGPIRDDSQRIEYAFPLDLTYMEVEDEETQELEEIYESLLNEVFIPRYSSL